MYYKNLPSLKYISDNSTDPVFKHIGKNKNICKSLHVINFYVIKNTFNINIIIDRQELEHNTKVQLSATLSEINNSLYLHNAK